MQKYAEVFALHTLLNFLEKASWIEYESKQRLSKKVLQEIGLTIKGSSGFGFLSGIGICQSLTSSQSPHLGWKTNAQNLLAVIPLVSTIYLISL